MEYKEEANIRSIGNLRLAEAEALQTSAATIQKWANRGASVYEKLVTDNAIMEANKVDVTAQAPELKSSWTKVGQVYNNIVLEGHKSAAINQFRSQIDKAEIDSKLDVEGFQKSLSTMKGKALESADPSIRAYLASEFDNYAVPRVGKKQIEKDSAELGVAVSNIQQKVQADINTAMEAVTNGDENVLATAEESIYSAAEQISQYDPELAKSFIKNYETKRLIAGYVGGFREAHAQGRGDAYIAELATKAQNITTVDKDGNKKTVGLTDEMVDKITERLKAENTILDAKSSEDRVKRINATAKQVIAIELQADIPQENYDQWLSSVDAAYNAGLFGDLSTAKGAMQARNKYTSLLNKQMAAIEKQAKDAGEKLKKQQETDQANTNIASILNGKIVVDENEIPIKPSQKDVDTFYGSASGELSYEQQVELAKNLYSKVGKFPSLMSETLKNGLIDENPNRVAATAKTILDLSKGLQGHDVVTGDQLAYASQIVANMEAGEPIEKAIDYARKSTVKDDATIDYRGKQYSVDQTAKSNAKWVEENMDGVLVDEATIKQRFETLVRNRVVNDGATLDFARSHALQVINSEYGEFNGNVMHMAPNVNPAYRSIDQTGDWVLKDFMKNLYDQGLIDSPIDSAGARNFLLVPVPGKENDLFPVAGGSVYQILKLTDEGPVPLIDKSSDQAVIYKPTLTSEIRQSQTLMPEAKQRISEKIIKTMSKKIAKDNAGSKVGPLGITNKAGIEQEAEAEARRMFEAGEITTSEIEKMLSSEEFDVFNLNIESANARYIGEN
jgi:hypothetical protein